MLERIGEAFALHELLTVVGKKLLPGETAPNFSLDYLDLADMTVQSVRLADVVGNIRLFNVVNSLARPVCHRVTHHWERLQADLPASACVYTISVDSPDDQAHWQSTEGILHQALSTHRSEQFGQDYGVWLKEWHLLQRSVFVIGCDNRIVYSEYVADQMCEPDYGAAMEVVYQAVMNQRKEQNRTTDEPL
ncbi:MAG TPA: redoxin domain-containing protein [Ktedonobacteraceae bacterium]|jgi:thiol peroxidase|nr:redoxin domain-containing protein [Ktedonobacteraceae bacterium]